MTPRPDRHPAATPEGHDVPPGLPGAVTVESPAATPASGPPAPAGEAPAALGRFRIERLVGAGTFGVVYRAYDPSLKRAVALKVARPEQVQSPRRVERFEREARAAGGLMHPHIVAVFDSGQDGGRHYIASAFVEGRSLDAALEELPDDHRLPLRQAVAIVRHLAEALAYAHKQGVVHRDIKPANVMLRDDGEPMLTDFGLAMRADEDRMTQADQVLGTPAYMAPEQARGQAGPASDQYSLGCVFFELLTGQAPFAAAGSDMVHYLYLHSQEAPPAPRSLVAGVPRDLETVCLKCLEKEPQKRYATCQELADDLRRWLEGEPVQVRQPGWGERARRWVRRNPALAALTAAVVALLLGMAAMGWGLAAWAWRNEERASEKADEAEANARQARENEELARQREGLAVRQQRRAEAARKALGSVFEASNPMEFLGLGLRDANERGGDTRAVDLLQRMARRLEGGELAREPELRADLLLQVGDSLRGLGQYDRAGSLLEAGVKLRRELVGDDHPEYARALFYLATNSLDIGDYDRAEAGYRQALRIQEKHLRPEHAETVDTLFYLAWALGMFHDPQATPTMQRVVAARQRAHGDDHHLTVVAKMGLAANYLNEGKLLDALPLIGQVNAYSAKVGGGQNNVQAVTLFQQGLMLARGPKVPLLTDQLDRARKLFEKALAVNRVGDTHVMIIFVRYELASVLRKQGKFAEAEAQYKECVRIGRATVGLSHPKAVIALDAYAALLRHDLKRPKEALALWREAERAHTARFGRTTRSRFWFVLMRSNFEARYGSARDATEMAMEALRLLPLTTGQDRQKVDELDNLGYALQQNRRVNPALAERCFAEGLALWRATKAGGDEAAASALFSLGEMYHEQARYAEAGPALAEAIERGKGTQWVRGDQGARLFKRLGDVRLAEGRFADAEAAYREAHTQSAASQPEPKVIDALIDLAGPAVEAGKWDEAIAALRRAAYFQRGKGGVVRYDRPMYLLALAQQAAGRRAEAVDTLNDLWRTFSNSASAGSRLFAARGALVLAPEAAAGPVEALCGLGEPGASPSAWVCQAQALALLRLGRPDDTVALLEAGPAPGTYRAPFVPILRGWAALQQGRLGEARRQYAEAEAEAQRWRVGGELAARARTRWRDRLEHRLLLTQLAGAIRGAAP